MEDLSFDKLEEYIDIISTGCKILEIKNSKDEPKTLIFKQPKAIDKMMATLVYNKTLQRAIDDGIPTIKEMEELLSKRKIFTEEDEKQIKKISSKLEAQKVLLSKTTKVQANKERILKIIVELEGQLREIRRKRDAKLGFTAEAKANEDKMTYLCSILVFDTEGNRVWPSVEDLNKCKDLDFRTAVLSEYSRFVSGIQTSIIRRIARSNLWRIRYSGSTKANIDLFGIPSKDFSADMLNLLYWSQFYQSIYEMLPEDQPGEDIIEDDDLLDAFMENYYKELKSERAARKSSKKHGSMDAFGKEEVVVTPTNPLHRDIEYDQPRQAAAQKKRRDDSVDVRDKGRKIRKSLTPEQKGSR